MDLICPNCSRRVTAAERSELEMCPSCNQALTASAAMEPCGADSDLARLSADLREAFGSGAHDALRPADVARLSSSSSHPLPLAPAPQSGLVGSRLGDFELLSELGRGGMGIVYRARQMSLDREVALKVLPSFVRRSRAAVARFRRESQAAGRLHHTNIVPVYAQGEHEGKFYYAMELIDGESLANALRSDSSVANLTLRPVTPPTGFAAPHSGSGSVASSAEAPRIEVSSVYRARRDYRRIAGLIAQVADALAHAHCNGVIHRDVKPHNLLLGRDNRIHITDFGLAHLMDEPHLTLSGELLGTPAYMSPEQVEGSPQDIDHRTDVYSLGVTLYELLTLRRPFDGKTREQIIHGICAIQPQAPRRLDDRIPTDLETICLRAMEKEPVRRHESAKALAEDLRRFAEDRPILTRRATRVEKAIKWSRRHKAASTAIAALCLVTLLAGALTASVISSRRGKAARLVEHAYGQLVYQDFHKSDRLLDDLDRAEQLGGDVRRTELIRALASVSGPDTAEPVQRLETLSELDPDDVETLYLLSWARWRNDQHTESLECFHSAENLGGAETAAGWFFRGLASQRTDPERAIASYKEARRLRAEDGEFFPQATLHLARARNQMMYRARSIDAFEGAENALLELIDYEVYGAYPCYLLSIAHRLAAEIYAGSEGTRPDTADDHYAQALHWAAAGQKLADPGNDAPWAAEAEAYESMGNFEAAIAARSEALERATKPLDKGENYHYRWRLYYWTGRLEEALGDLEAHQEVTFAANKPFYEAFPYDFVYPLLVHAQAGRMENAIELARRIAEQPEGSSDNSALYVLWSATCLRLLGQANEAQSLLEERADAVDPSVGLVPGHSPEWMKALYAYAAGDAPFEVLLEATDAAELSRVDRLTLAGEAYFHAAALKLSAGDRVGAEKDLGMAYRSFDAEKRYTFQARTLRVRMLQDQDWPPWIAAWEDNPSPDVRSD